MAIVPQTCRASVVTAPGVSGVMELPVPDVSDDAGLLRVEAAGICGSDIEYLPCGHCQWCRGRDFRLCDECDAFSNASPKRFGSTPIAGSPGLWGALPLGNGFEWAYFAGGAGPGKTVVVFGPGQQGLGCVVAAKEAGAERVILIGLDRDAERLGVGEALHLTVCPGGDG